MIKYILNIYIIENCKEEGCNNWIKNQTHDARVVKTGRVPECESWGKSALEQKRIRAMIFPLYKWA